MNRITKKSEKSYCAYELKKFTSSELVDSVIATDRLGKFEDFLEETGLSLEEMAKKVELCDKLSQENKILRNGFLGLQFAMDTGYTTDEHQNNIDQAARLISEEEDTADDSSSDNIAEVLRLIINHQINVFRLLDEAYASRYNEWENDNLTDQEYSFLRDKIFAILEQEVRARG